MKRKKALKRSWKVLAPLTLTALYFRSLEGIFCARLAADVLSGVVGWILARSLISRMMKRNRVDLEDDREYIVNQ